MLWFSAKILFELVKVCSFFLRMENGIFYRFKMAEKVLHCLGENLCNYLRRISERTAAECAEYQHVTAVFRSDLENASYALITLLE